MVALGLIGGIGAPKETVSAALEVNEVGTIDDDADRAMTVLDPLGDTAFLNNCHFLADRHERIAFLSNDNDPVACK